MLDYEKYNFSDFNEDGYGRLIDIAKMYYRFEPFGTQCIEQHVIWRHDIDISMHRALWCARAEKARNVQSTYFFLLHSEFYNLLENSVMHIVKEIIDIGHWIGLHFDPTIYPDCDDLGRLEFHVDNERTVIERMFGVTIDALSYHNPTVSNVLAFDQDKIGGLWNAYGRTLKADYTYMSDSNGYWRFQRVPEVLSRDSRPSRLHLLTHPEWWTHDTMSPRQRVTAAVEGRAKAVMKRYDDSLAKWGRLNVG